MTIQRAISTVSLAAVAGASALDGATAGLTYQFADMPLTGRIKLNKRTDCVNVSMSGTGSDGNTAAFKIWGYATDGPAKLIYSGTGTLGTAVAGTSQLFADTFSASDVHVATTKIADSAANRVASISFDAAGYGFLVFEGITFTTLSAVAFQVHELGFGE